MTDSNAKYGPQRWPAGRPRDTRSPLLTGAELAATGGNSSCWDVEPWLRHHGVPVDVGTRVLAWLGHSSGRGNFTVKQVVGHYTGSFSPGQMDPVRGHYSYNKPLAESDHAARDILIEAITEAKEGMPDGGGISYLDTWKWAPAGVVESTKWWVARSVYHSGRAPMARLVELPDDVLRCICEQLVPLVPPTERTGGGYTPQSNEDFIKETREFCEEYATDDALQRVDELELDEVIGCCDGNLSAMGYRIQTGIGRGDPSACFRRSPSDGAPV